MGVSMVYKQLWLRKEETLSKFCLGHVSQRLKKHFWPDQIVHALNPSTWKLGRDGGEFEVSLKS